MDAHKKNEEAVKQPKSCRKGYMGQVNFLSQHFVLLKISAFSSKVNTARNLYLLVEAGVKLDNEAKGKRHLDGGVH